MIWFKNVWRYNGETIILIGVLLTLFMVIPITCTALQERKCIDGVIMYRYSVDDGWRSDRPAVYCNKARKEV